MKRIFWILITPTILLALIGLVIDFFIFPRVSEWAIIYAKKILREEAQLELSIESSHLSLHRLSVFLKGVQIQGSQPGLSLPLLIDQVQVRLDPLGLILGQIQLAAVVLDGASVQIDFDTIPENKSGPKRLPIAEIFKWTDKVPIEKLALRRSQISVISKKSDFEIHVKPLDALLSNQSQHLALKLYAPSITLQSHRFPEPASFSAETTLVLSPRQLVIDVGQVMSLGQTLKFSGAVLEPSDLLLHPKGKFHLTFSSELEHLGTKIQAFLAKKVPDLKGQIQIDSDFTIDGLQGAKGRAFIDARSIFIGPYEVGNFNTNILAGDQKIQAEEIKIQHSAGSASLLKASLSTLSPFDFKADVDVKRLDLQQLFQAIDLPRIPTWLKLQGHLPCHGQIHEFRLECDGKVEGHDLIVKTKISDREPILVEVPEARAQGTLYLDKDKVKIKSKLFMAEYEGTVEGEVGYKTGFDFKFKTDSLGFSAVKSLARLDFKGITQLDGYTRGDSESAILQINTKVEDFIFEKYNLGQMTGILRYEKGHLLVKQIAGSLPRTLYQGQVDINLNDQKLSGTLDLPHTDLDDIKKVFTNIYAFPLRVRGDGKAHIEFSGPFDFWKMNYRVTSQFRNGQIQTEGFSNLNFNVRSDSGLITAENVDIRKGSSLIQLTGTIQPDQLTDLKFDGINWRLEESELANKIKSNMVGAFNFNGDLKGPLMHPELRIKGHLAELIVDEQELPSSYFDFRINRKAIAGTASLFGSRIQGEFKLPFENSGEPLQVKAKTADWHFASLLAIFGAAQLQDEYESHMTSDIDLVSESGLWTELTGTVLVKNFLLKRGVAMVQNPEPIDIKLNKGRINLKNFILSGPHSEIKVTGHDFSFHDLALSVQARSDLRLAHILVPFLEDLGGPFSLEASMSGSYQRPEILGNARIENTFIKIKGFPHPVEKLKTDIVFSHSKILVQNIKGFLGGGTITGDGTISINGINDIPTSVRIRAENLSLNVPDKVRSQGSANLTFSGRWFPFVLGGTYVVSSAFIDKEFGDGDVSPTQIRESIYLPKVLKEGTFDPVLLDLNVLLERNVVVKNSQVDGTVTGQLQVKGPPQNPVITGKLVIDKNSRLMFKDKVFEVQNGTVSLNNPEETTPEIYVTAQSRVNDYDISLMFQGTPKSPNLKLSSVPPLPEPEIISLLALGITSDKLDRSQSRDQAKQVGYEAGSVLLNQSNINKFFQSTLGGKFELTSSFDSTKNINVPKLTFRKNITRKWSTSVSKGVGNEQNPTEVKVQYKINNNVSAVGSWEGREAQEGTTVRSGTRESQSVFGLDLEFKREFK